MENLDKELLEVVKSSNLEAKDGKIEIVLRTGPAEKKLDAIQPIQEKKLEIIGEIDTVYNFLSKRSHLFNPDKCNLHANRDLLYISFVGNESLSENKHDTIVTGKLVKSKEFQNLPLDTQFTPSDFAKFVRRNKNIFASEQQWKEIFTNYSSFTAKVNSEIEKSKDQSGNSTDMIIQKVTHNLIQEFKIFIPLIKGGNMISVNIEIDVDNKLNCSLFAPDIETQFEDEAKRMIDNELIKEINGVEMRNFCVTYFK